MAHVMHHGRAEEERKPVIEFIDQTEEEERRGGKTKKCRLLANGAFRRLTLLDLGSSAWFLPSIPPLEAAHAADADPLLRRIEV